MEQENDKWKLYKWCNNLIVSGYVGNVVGYLLLSSV